MMKMYKILIQLAVGSENGSREDGSVGRGCGGGLGVGGGVFRYGETGEVRRMEGCKSPCSWPSTERASGMLPSAPAAALG